MKQTIAIFLILQTLTVAPQNGDSLLQQVKRSNSITERYSTWEQLFDYYEYRGQLDSVGIAVQQLLNIAIDSKRDSLMASAYTRAGAYFGYIGEYDQSLDYLFKGLNTAEKCKNSNIICFAAKDLGAQYKSLKNFPEAIKYLKKAEKQFAGNIDPVDINRTYSHLSECYLGLGQTDSALRYVQLATESVLPQDEYGYARPLYIFATIYEKKGENDRAETYYKKCIDYAVRTNLVLPLANASNHYSNLLLNTGKLEIAKTYALLSMKASRSSKRKLDIINTAGLLQNIYDKLGLKDSSYYFSDIRNIYRDSVFDEQKLIQLQNLRLTQQIKEKENEERQLRLAAERKQNLQYAAITLILVIFIILFLLFSHSVIATQQFIRFMGILALLIVFEFINLLLHPYLDKITHHSPFLMLAIMVIIAALLIPLHHRLEKWIIHKLVEKNKKIRLAVAKKTIARLEEKGKLN